MKKAPRTAAPAKAAVTEKAAPPVVGKKAKAGEVKPEVLCELGRDNPFAPVYGRTLLRGSAHGGGLVLTGVVWDAKGKPMAIINGVLAREGETVGGKKVVRIEKTRVVVEEKGSEYVLTLSGFGGGRR